MVIKNKKLKMMVILFLTALIIGIMVKNVYGIFATYCRTENKELTIDLRNSNKPIITKKLKGNNSLTVNVQNSGKGVAYLRFKIFIPSFMTVNNVSSNISLKDGYYYYSKPLAGEEITEDITFEFGNVPSDKEFNYNNIIIAEMINISSDGKNGDWNNQVLDK
ncbi:MAG: hypothetical protein J6O41_05805 [Clostridia bacterium]|nr:hypothetical protein [Clostridia bacterium]